MAWSPDESQLRELVGYLRDSLNGRDAAAQNRATSMLAQAKHSSDITNYLIYILQDLPKSSNIPSTDIALVRSAAAITLKNLIRSKYQSLPPANKIYIQSSILRCLDDPSSQVRGLVGNVIAEMVRGAGVLGWPEVFPELLSLAENSNGSTPAHTQEGAMSALNKICEDNKKALDRDYQGSRPLDVILPRLYQITTSPSPRVRALALEAVNVFVPQKPQALLNSIDALMSRLFQLASDDSEDVRRHVCRSFVQLVDVNPEKLLPHMKDLVNYMISQQRDSADSALALDAAEFWLSIGEHKSLCSSLQPYLITIIPTLLASMVYGEDDIARLEGERDDADEEDKSEDLKPNFAKSKSSRVGQNGQSNVSDIKDGRESTDVTYDEGYLSEGEIEEYADADPDDGLLPEDEWNLRKCSAAALDVLASFFHGPVFEVTLPYLRDNLTNQEWPRREAAVLAIGAVAEGCMDAVTPHLPELIPFLITLLQDKEPVVRQITCWALGRYSRWAAYLPTPEEKAALFEPMMEGILRCMLDRNKSVQEAAASAFSNLEEAAQLELNPYCEPIVRQFVRCFNVYKDRNMFILYDCVQTLAEHIGPELAKPGLMELLMPALIERWGKVSDQSRELFPLLECLSYVATALGDAFSPFALPIFSRCIFIIKKNLEDYILALNNEALDKPDKDFLVTSLDLLSSVIQALPEAKSGELVTNSEPKMFDLLRFCMEDPNNDVRQSSYALLGDCAIQIFPHLQPVLPTLVPILIEQLDVNSMPDEEADAAFSVINNACWSCGEIAIKDKEGMLQYIEKLYERLFEIISNPGIPNSVNENAAIALGRLGLWYSSQMARHLGGFARSFLSTISTVDYTDEKGQALLGFNKIIIVNPQAMGECLLEYFKVAAFLPVNKIRDQQIKESFQQVFSGYQGIMPDFNGFVEQLGPKTRQKLQVVYGV